MKDNCDIELWGRFINAERKEEFDMVAEKNVYIGSAYRHLQVISQDEEKRMEYEARARAIRDYNQIVLEAEQRGEERGIQILIADHIEENVPKEKTMAKLQKHYHLNKAEAEQYYEKYLISNKT